VRFTSLLGRGLEAQEHLFLNAWGSGDGVSLFFGDALDGEDLIHGYEGDHVF
jgi:hypothetical protein